MIFITVNTTNARLQNVAQSEVVQMHLQEEGEKEVISSGA